MGDNYDLQAVESARIAAPELPYQPPAPKQLKPGVGLIGCGGITQHHLEAYRQAGWPVVAMWDRNGEAAEKRRDEYFPSATGCADATELLARRDVTVVDIATHPAPRVALIGQAIAAGKPVLSQKPFVMDLAEGRRLVGLAREKGVKLAVNQNGRWAPYLAYIREAVRQGLIGEVSSIAMNLEWDHTWTAGTPYAGMPHLILQDFGIHWFDAAASFLPGRKPVSVYASVTPAPGQTINAPLMAQAQIKYADGTVSLNFNGSTKQDPRETIAVVGSEGTLRSTGGVCGPQTVSLATAEGIATPKLEGNWFPDGFRGAMGELLCAIEEDREPMNNASDNLRSLGLCFAAMESADSGEPVSLLPKG